MLSAVVDAVRVVIASIIYRRRLPLCPQNLTAAIIAIPAHGDQILITHDIISGYNNVKLELSVTLEKPVIGHHDKR